MAQDLLFVPDYFKAAIKHVKPKPFRTFLLVAFTVWSGINLPSQSRAGTVYEDYTFSTIAGANEPGPGWFDGPTNACRFNSPGGLTRDGNGNIYIADTLNHTIRKLTPDGQVSTIAGFAETFGSADGIGGVARFNQPQDVAFDSHSNLFVADYFNHTIRKITPDGQVTTVAGLAGTAGSVDGIGSAARLNFPAGVVVGSGDNLYVMDTGNHAIRQITPDGTVSTPAGALGTSGKVDGTGNDARFSYPQFAALDPSGNMYVADTGNHAIRKITPAWKVTTLAGLLGTAGTNNGTGTAARFNTPCGIALSASGFLYVADYLNHAIRKISSAGAVTTLAGSIGVAGNLNGQGAAAYFSYPLGVTLASDLESVLITDYSHTLRKITSAGLVTTVAGLPVTSGTADGKGETVAFTAPVDVAVDNATNLYIADLNNCTIRKMTPDGTVKTLAGLARTAGSANGTGTGARFYLPVGVAVDATGNVFVADTSNHTIRKITPAGAVTTFAGLAGSFGSANGTGSAARFYNPFRLTVDLTGNVYVADTWNHTIRKITPAGVVTTLAGSAGVQGSADGGGSAARFSYPEGIAVDSGGNLYVADDGNNTIRKITPDGTVSTLAGKAGVQGSDDGDGAAASFYAPYGLTVDHDGNVYVADSSNATIRKITPSGTVTTLAGVPKTYGSINGVGQKAQFGEPAGLAVDGNGNLYVADPSQNVIRKGHVPLPDVPFASPPTEGSGDPFTLDVTNLTTTSWSWKLVRKPANSTNAFTSSIRRNPAFKPDVDDVFVVRFEGKDDTGHAALANIQVQADVTPPLLTIVTPTDNQQVSGWLTVEGTAEDHGGIASVHCQLNDAPWSAARTTNNWVNWSTAYGLTMGTNLLRAYAVDMAGNHSSTNTLSVVASETFSLRLDIRVSSATGIQSTDVQLSGSLGSTGQIEVSTDLHSWTPLRSFTLTNETTHFIDSTFNAPPYRFYRTTGP